MSVQAHREGDRSEGKGETVRAGTQRIESNWKTAKGICWGPREDAKDANFPLMIW